MLLAIYIQNKLSVQAKELCPEISFLKVLFGCCQIHLNPHVLALFGCSHIHINLHVLRWIGVELELDSTPIHTNTHGLK